MICPYCGANWTPRKPNPVKCPRCWTHLQDQDIPATPVKVDAAAVASKRRKPVPGVAGDATGCKSCGGLNGMHQKGCKR